jgi:nonsense-mediated mRNA decay protein 3
MKKFCYLCGKKVSEGNLCEECFLKMKSIAVPEKIEIEICKRCSAIKSGKFWKKAEIKEVVKDFVKKECSVDVRDGKAYVIMRIPFGEKLLEVKKEIEIVPKKSICNSCSKLAGGYYESVLQVRNFDKINEILSVAKSENFYVKNVKEGIDLYFLRKSSAERVAKKLKKMFKNIEIKKSFKLATRKNGKNLYRHFVLVRKIEEE